MLIAELKEEYLEAADYREYFDQMSCFDMNKNNYLG